MRLQPKSSGNRTAYSAEFYRVGTCSSYTKSELHGHAKLAAF